MNLELTEQVRQMGFGDHICLIYDNLQDQMAAVVPYMRQGLERNEFCIYITDDRTLDEVRTALARGGVDVEAELARGALLFATKREAYLESGSFDPKLMLDFLKAAVETAAKNGFTGFRATGEMTWALGSECGCDRLIEYEALLNEFFPRSKATVICQYSSTRFSPEVVRDVLRTHPIAIISDQVCPNPYYETPKMVLGKESVAKRMEWMKDQLRLFRKKEITLKEAVASRDEFMCVASHELKTPLTSMKLQTQSLMNSLERGTEISPEKLKKAVYSADRQIKRLTKLVEDLLDVSKINADRLSLSLESVDLSKLASGVVERFFDQLKAANCELKLKMPKSPVFGQWDRFRIEQVMNNLLTNAMKYGQGKPIEVTIEPGDQTVKLSVSDQGIGISEENQLRIFERFERAVSPNEVSGLGLGLFIVRQVVEAHGGKISVKSTLGKGSIFTVELSLKPAKVQAA